MISYINGIQTLSDWSVILINYLLRLIIIGIVKNMNYKTFSIETTQTMVAIFVIQFLNTGIILLFINADLSQSGIPILDKLLVLGYHRDFTVDWYKDVGKIITSTMIKNISWPIIEFFIWFTYRTVFRMWDQRWCNCCSRKKSTRQKTMQGYIEIYSGPVYDIHYKYSSILNIIFITFLYGPGIPILFPIALLSLAVIYVKERLCLAYSYREPLQMLDPSLNKKALSLLKLPPLLSLAFAFLMFNNRQIFTNQVFFLETYSSAIVSTPLSLEGVMPHIYPVLITLGGLVTLWIVLKVARLVRGVGLEIVKIPEKQDQFNLYEVMRTKQKKNLIKKKDIDNIIEENAVEKLQDFQNCHKKNRHLHLIGLTTYQVLDNPEYQMKYQYIPHIPAQRDEVDEWMYRLSEYTFDKINKRGQ